MVIKGIKLPGIYGEEMGRGTSNDMVKRWQKYAENSMSQEELIEELAKQLMSGKRGRPTKYKKHYSVLLLKHMARGFTFNSFGGIVGVSVSRLYDWCGRHAEFREAKMIGITLSELWWMNVGRGAATGQIKNFSASGWIFIMKNLFKWRDKHEIDLETKEIKEVIHKVEIGLDGDITQEMLEVPADE